VEVKEYIIYISGSRSILLVEVEEYIIYIGRSILLVEAEEYNNIYWWKQEYNNVCNIH